MSSARAIEHERKRKHFELLARPNPRKVTKKFDPAKRDKVVKLKKYKSEEIGPSKRIEILAQPNRVTPKYKAPSTTSFFVDKAVLEATCTARLDHLSKPTVRYLEAMKNEYEVKNKPYADKFNEKIGISFDTIYYHNAKSLMHIAAEKKKKRLGERKKKPKGWDACGDRQRLEEIAKPKPPRKPPPRPPRKWIPLEKLKTRIEKLAVPNNVYIRPSQDSFKLEQRARIEGAQKYTISERVKELSKIPDWRTQKPWTPHGVTKAALKYKISDRMQELAHPHARSKAIEADLKENAYDVSRAALKYKASPRIVELAKHVER